MKVKWKTGLYADGRRKIVVDLTLKR